MAAPALEMQIVGMHDVGRAMAGMTIALQNRIVGKALRFAGKPAVKAARNIVRATSEDTGALRKSLGVKLKRYRRGDVIVLIIGARAHPRFWVADPDRAGKIRKPHKYAHQVELGNVFSGANPYLRPGFEATKAEALQRFRFRAEADIEIEAAKLAAVGAAR